LAREKNNLEDIEEESVNNFEERLDDLYRKNNTTTGMKFWLFFGKFCASSKKVKKMIVSLKTKMQQ